MTHTPASPVDRAIVRRRRDGIAPIRSDAASERIDAAPTRTDAIAGRVSNDGPTAAPDSAT